MIGTKRQQYYYALLRRTFVQKNVHQQKIFLSLMEIENLGITVEHLHQILTYANLPAHPADQHYPPGYWFQQLHYW
jgi:hypothetical protein